MAFRTVADMKTKIAMVISIAGVLVAGSAAALVNAQVLGGTSSASPLAVDSPSQTQTTLPTGTIVPVVTNPSVAATTGPTAAPVAQPAPASSQATYAVGDAGSVTLDTAGDVLTIVGVTPTAGWTVTKSEAQDSTNVEVKFQAGTVEVEFHANLLFGVVTPSVESNDSSVTGSSVDDNGSGRHSGGDDDSGHGGDDD
jgi:hypothetical protein